MKTADHDTLQVKIKLYAAEDSHSSLWPEIITFDKFQQQDRVNLVTIYKQGILFTCSRDCSGQKSLDQLRIGSKRHFLYGSSLGPYLTFWSKGSKIFVRHLGFWRPSWIFEPKNDFNHIFGHRKVSNENNFFKMYQNRLKGSC